MPHIFNGRYTVCIEAPFVVFLIGMRVHKPLAVRKWLPQAQAMGRMISELYQHPEKGFLGAQSFGGLLSPAMVQYWRSFEALEKFARDPDEAHLPAWRAFNKLVGDDDSVGIWHETYQVQPGGFEVIYGNMPRFGLARARGAEHMPISQHRATSRKRMTGEAFE